MKSKHLLLMLLLAFALPWAAMAQSVATYTFSTGQSQAKWITLSGDATELVASGKDDTYSSLTDIGFSFPFGAGTYSKFWANSNGVFSFNSTPAADRTNAFGNGNYGSYTTSQPKICGISIDMSTGNNGYVKYELTGTAPNRILVCEFYLNGSGWSTSTSATIKWQVQLYEADSKVALVYGDAPSSDPTDFQTGLSASSSDIVLVDPTTHTATPTNTYNNTTYSVWPGAYRYYEFAAPTEPYIVLDPASATVMTGFTTTLTATYGNVTGTPSITYSSSNASVATVSGNGTTATVRGVAPGTATITATMNGTYTATCAITVEDPSYCTPSFSNPGDDYISNFATTGGTTNINNTSTYESGGYSNYYDSQAASIEAGETLTCTVTPSSEQWSYGHAIWVDWNNDYEFAENEKVAYTSSYATGAWTGSFEVPSTIAAGDYHMRVIHAYNQTVTNPCMTNNNFGEAEDYKLTVLAPSAYPKPQSLTVSDLTNISATIGWTAPNTDVTSYKYQYKPEGGEWSALTSTTALSAPLTGLTSNTNYTFQVKAIYSNGESDFVSTDFTTMYCASADMCEISYELEATPYNGTYYYGWYYSGIYVKDASTDEELAFLTIPAGESSASGTLAICDGREIRFEWYSTGYDNLFVASYAIYDVNGQEIASNNGPMTSSVDYIMNCSNCLKPTNLAVTNVGTRTATVTWEGEHEYFDLQYKPDYTYHFEDGLGAWTTIDADGDGFNWMWSEQGIAGYQGSKCLYSQSYDNNGSQPLDPDNYLVSPKVQLGGSISFWACSQDGGWLEHFGVAVSTTGNTDADDFTTIQDWTCASTRDQSPWTLYTVDLSAYTGEGYVAIRHYDSENNFYLDIDEITILGPGETMPEWTIVENLSTSTYTFNNNLIAETPYAVQVRGYCTGETQPTAWTASVNFTTLSGNIFITEGNWNEANNWRGGEVPAAGSSVVIAANVTIPAGYTADAGNVTIQNSATITVAEGGQFKTTYSGVIVTMQKHINGTDFGTVEEPTDAGYLLITNPVITSQNPATMGMTANSYDLYSFDQTEEGEEWQNYKENVFTLANTQGYLYANSEDIDIEFTGEANVTNLNKKLSLTSYSTAFGGFNLVGNPYTCNGYLSDGRAFYVMNPDGDEIVTATNNVITPMTGIFVDIEYDDNINFTTTAPAPGGDPDVVLNVINGNKTVDRAVVRFGEGSNLRKFQLNPNHTKLYIPQDNDYAVVYTEENQGEMPVSFKAEKNDSYSLSFNTENVEFGYLHLIDNLTGNDVDLLETPSYSFEAKTTDYASRFKLVFAAGSNANDESFAFMSDGNLIVNNEGEATLQVIDVNGRILRSESINGSASINMNTVPGVYMIRVINGENVKTQKMVVR